MLWYRGVLNYCNLLIFIIIITVLLLVHFHDPDYDKFTVKPHGQENSY